ncbi:MAG: hypothetical protein CUN54_02355 [Phototrophicales bacterium]|nr:MAG: hypothetical protein CUN54_02355 [Phototrophicales bacterium]
MTDTSAATLDDCTNLTIYKGNSVLVSDRRNVDLQPGANLIEFPNILADVVRQSINVSIRDQSFNAVVTEHRFLYDLADNTMILKRYLGEMIEVRTQDGQVYAGQYVRVTKGLRNTAFSNAASDDLLLCNTDGQLILIAANNISEIHLPENRELIQQPLLQIMIESQEAGTCPIEVTYIASGIDWAVDYNVIVSENDQLVTFNGWATLTNKTDVSFNDVYVKLVQESASPLTQPQPTNPPQPPAANRSLRPSPFSRQNPPKPLRPPQPPRPPLTRPGSRLGRLNQRPPVDDGGRFGDPSHPSNDPPRRPLPSRFPTRIPPPAPAPLPPLKRVSQYRYPIERPVDLENDETRHIKLVDLAPPTAQLAYIYDASPPVSKYPRNPNTDRNQGDTQVTEVNAFITFNANEQTATMVNLPAGELRIYQQDHRGASTLVGNRKIKHLSGDDRLEISLGALPDVDGKRTQKDFRRLENSLLEETYRIRLRNQRQDRPVRVTVLERLFRWGNWRIVNTSHSYTKQDATSITFDVTIPPREKMAILYTVRYFLTGMD